MAKAVRTVHCSSEWAEFRFFLCGLLGVYKIFRYGSTCFTIPILVVSALVQADCESEDTLPFPVLCWYEHRPAMSSEEESTVLYVINLIYNQYCVALPSHACCHGTIN